MMRRRWLGRSVLFVLLCPALAVAQEPPPPEVIERVRAASQPGPEHMLLSGLSGTWDQEIRVWSEPGGEAMTSKGVGTAKMMLGGRFLEIRSVTDMFGGQGESISIIGFDRRHEEFTILQLDTFGTYWVAAAGVATGDTIVMGGRERDPVIGHTQEYEFRVHVRDADTWTLEIVFLDEMHTRGKGPFRMVEIVSRRRAQ